MFGLECQAMSGEGSVRGRVGLELTAETVVSLEWNSEAGEDKLARTREAAQYFSSQTASSKKAIFQSSDQVL